MSVQDDGKSKSSGYVEIPIQVLYKTEYIDSAVQECRNNNNTNVMKMAKLSIRNLFCKLRDRIGSALRGYYQEIIINNVDCKTRQNMIGYIKSLNLETKELTDADGTKVIVVDIGPIKKKPEMNDLLVYIENEKLKIARKTEVKSKSQDKENAAIRNAINKVTDCKGESSSSTKKDVSSDKILVHPRGGGDGTVKSKAPSEQDRNKVRVGSKLKNKKCGTDNSLRDNSLSSKINTSSALKGIKKKESQSNPVIACKYQSKNILVLEDPLTKAERKIKMRMESKPKASKEVEPTKALERKESKTLNTCRTSIANPFKKCDDDCSMDSSSERIGLPVDSLINSKMNGIGIDWNKEKLVHNDRKINLIERCNAIREKETSVNVIAQYYQEEKEKKVSGKNNQLIFTNMQYEEKATETDKSFFGSELMTTTTETLVVREDKEQPLRNKSRSRSQNKKDVSTPLIQLKSKEPYTYNGMTSDPSFIYPSTDTNAESLAKSDNGGNKDCLNDSRAIDGEKISNKKKRSGFARFCKRLFSGKKNSKKECVESETRYDYIETIPLEVHVECRTIDETETKREKGKPDGLIASSSGKKNSDNKFTQPEDDQSKADVVKYSDRSSRSVETSTAESQVRWLDRGDNYNTSVHSTERVSEFKVPQISRSSPFDWMDHQGNEFKKDKRINVVNKLYEKLKSFKSRKEISDSEITSTSFSWDDDPKGFRESSNFFYDEVSSLDSVRVSVDTVQSVTQTVIKRLAKSYPKEKRK